MSKGARLCIICKDLRYTFCLGRASIRESAYSPHRLRCCVPRWRKISRQNVNCWFLPATYGQPPQTFQVASGVPPYARTETALYQTCLTFCGLVVLLSMRELKPPRIFLTERNGFQYLQSQENSLLVEDTMQRRRVCYTYTEAIAKEDVDQGCFV